MIYNVQGIPKFEKELKRLVKKYPSLKTEYLELVHSLKEKPVQGISLVMIVIKFVYQLHQKERVNQEVQE